MRLAFFFAMTLWAAAAVAQYALEIIPLRHATVQQVLPILQPLVEPGGTLSGNANQLFVRASPSNVADLKRVLETIDRAPRRLEILVRYSTSLDASRREIGASGTIGNRGSAMEIRAQDASRRGEEHVDQRLTVLEGGRATIAAGRGDEFRDRSSGFEVVPRLSGDRVTLDIAQQREAGSQFQVLSTSISARLGEWVELGGVASSSTQDRRGILSSGQSAASASRSLWLKVQELPN